MTMNNFIFENSTKVFFGKGCVKEYLCCLMKAYGDTVMLCYGGGSIKKNGIYEEITDILHTGTDADLDRLNRYLQVYVELLPDHK